MSRTRRAAGACVEVLERRSYFSGALTPTLSGALPASLVAGEAAKIAQKVTLTNSGDAALSGNTSEALFLSAGTTVDGSAIPLGSATSKKINLAPGKHAAFTLKLPTVPASVPDGAYHVLLQVTDPNGATSSAASAGTIAIAAARPDLAGQFVSVPVTAKLSKPIPMSIAIQNVGNTTFKLPKLQVVIEVSQTSVFDENAVQTFTFTTPINLKPGKSVTRHFAPPGTFAQAGIYYFFTILDPANSIGDVDTANDIFVSAAIAVG